MILGLPYLTFFWVFVVQALGVVFAILYAVTFRDDDTWWTLEDLFHRKKNKKKKGKKEEKEEKEEDQL